MYRPLPPKGGNGFCIFRARTSQAQISRPCTSKIPHPGYTDDLGHSNLGCSGRCAPSPSDPRACVFSLGVPLSRPRFSRVRSSSAWPLEATTSGMPRVPQMKTNIFAGETGWAMSTDRLTNKQSRNSQEADDVRKSPE